MGTIITFQFRRGTTSEWANVNPVLRPAEPGYDITLKKHKLGDGITRWLDLPFVESSESSTSSVISINGQTGIIILDKTDVGLSDVDNTADVNKPLSAAAVSALALKANVGLESAALPVDGGSAVTIDLSSLNTVIPVNLTAANCTITFTNAANGRFWRIKFKQDSTGGRTITLPSVTLVGGPSFTPASDPNAISFLTFYKDSDGIFAFVPGVGSAAPPPGQVTGLTAGTPTQTTQPLTWDATPNATSYLIEYKLAGAGSWSAASTVSTNSGTVTGLTANTSYDFRVTAINSGGNGTPSSTLTTSTYPNLPGQVTGLTLGIVSATTQDLSWSSVSGATSYLVQYRVTGAGSWSSGPSDSGTSATVTGLTATTSYDYRVTASNVAGSGTPSSVVTGSTLTPPLLSGKFVGERNLMPKYFATDAGGTYQLMQTAHQGVTAIELTFANWVCETAGEGDKTPGNAYTIDDCFIVTNAGSNPATLSRVTFGGSNSVTVADGGIAKGTATVSIAPGDKFYVRTYVHPTAGGKYPLLDIGTTDYPGELSTPGSNVASNTSNNFSSFLTTYGPIFGPVAVTGIPTGTHASVIGLGDSIMWGNGDDFSGTTHLGFFIRQMSGNRSYLRICLSGENAGQFISAMGNRRRTLIGACDYIVCEYGVNDAQVGTSASGIESNLLSIWTDAKTRNPSVKIYQTTITPKSASTDAWATTTNQTTDSTVNPRRIAVNAWVRAGAPIDPVTKTVVAVGTSGALLAGNAGHPLAGYFEISDLVETARDSGIWLANYTADGIHPTATGHIAMSAGITLSTLAFI